MIASDEPVGQNNLLRTIINKNTSSVVIFKVRIVFLVVVFSKYYEGLLLIGDFFDLITQFVRDNVKARIEADN